MKIKNYIFIFLILLITIASVNSKQFNYEELKKKSFLNKIKYLTFHFFAKIEQYTLYFIMGLRSYNIIEPYDFFSCFIFGCFLRICFLILKKIFKKLLNTEESYIYNEPDNTENLYAVISKLNEFSKNMKTKNENNINNNTTINDDINIKNIEERIKSVNNKLLKLEKTVNNLGKSYEEEKNHIKANLKTIEECQKFIIDSLSNKDKED